MKGVIVILIVLAVSVSTHAATTLIYDPGGSSGAVIQAAMADLGIAYDLRNSLNPVTALDLGSHDVLVIGWNDSGDMGGVGPLAGGITGNILLTGHNADWHVEYGNNAGSPDPGDAAEAAATRFLSQAITFAQCGAGTGLVALGDYSTAFSYLPVLWGISATGSLAEETVSAFTASAVNSGVYASLTPSDMSGWNSSYRARFEGWDSEFVPFELGDADGDDVVTIARIVSIPDPGAIILGSLGLSLVGYCRCRRAM